MPPGQLAAINEQAEKEGALSWVGRLLMKSLSVFLGNPSWASLPSVDLSGHNSPFISLCSTPKLSPAVPITNLHDAITDQLPKSHNAPLTLHLTHLSGHTPAYYAAFNSFSSPSVTASPAPSQHDGTGHPVNRVPCGTAALQLLPALWPQPPLLPADLSAAPSRAFLRPSRL